MHYVSTRGQIEPVGFADAVLMGLADDGGLIVPRSVPDCSDRMDAWAKLPYPDLAREVIGLFATDLPDEELAELIRRTYGSGYFVHDPAPDRAVAPVVPVGNLWVQELWHGPTLAFKDIALQLLGNLFEFILRQRDGRLTILGATSGDTGSAAIYGCRGRDRLSVYIMHPHGRVSDIQRKQMTTVPDPNVHNLSIEGSFDDCQRIMKTLAADLDFKRRHHIGAVNSVNWARVLAQVVYFIHGSLEVRRRTDAAAVRYAVPTGNFGDILAGWYARKMGAPIDQLILATNENDILARFFRTGEYSLGEVYQTLSPSMDIQVASNFERYLWYRLGCDGAKLRTMMEHFAQTGSLSVPAGEAGGVDADVLAGSARREDVLATIGRYAGRHDYVLDPHTACGVFAAECVGDGAWSEQPPADLPTICLATAHPAKFPEAIRLATGRDDLARHPAIDELADLPERCEVLPSDPHAVRELIDRTEA